MKVADSINVSLSALVSKPSSILPFYLVGTGITMVARVIPIIAAAIAYLVLLAQGRIDAAREALSGLDLSALEQDPENVNPEELPVEQIAEGLSHLATPEVAALMALGILGFLLVAVLLGAVVVAGQTHVVYSALRGGEPILDGVRGLVNDGLTFVGVRLTEIALQLFLAAIFGILVSLIAVGTGGVALAVAGLFLGLFWALSALLVRAIFVFAPQSIVVDGTGTVGAIKRSAGFIVRRPAAYVAYVLLFFAVMSGLLTLSGLFAFANIPQLTALLAVLVVTPSFHLLKTALYVDESIVEMPLFGDRSDPPVGTRFVDAMRTGVSSAWAFTRRTPGLLVLSFGFFGLGGAAGYAAIRDFGLSMEPPENAADVFGVLPVDVFVQIAANNWLVAVAQSYAGFVFGVPTAVNLAFNGFLIGALAGIDYETIVFLALIVPHAIIELPALAVSGAVGFHLGLVGWRRFRGRIDDRDVAEEIRRAYRVLIGLAVAFVVAAFVEAFLTPRIAGLVL